jgi:hypothetical protein
MLSRSTSKFEKLSVGYLTADWYADQRNSGPVRFDENFDVEIHAATADGLPHEFQHGIDGIDAKAAHRVGHVQRHRVDGDPEIRERSPDASRQRHLPVILRLAAHDGRRIAPRGLQQGRETRKIVLPVGIDLHGVREAALLRARNAAHDRETLAAIERVALILDFGVIGADFPNAFADCRIAPVVGHDDGQLRLAQSRQDRVQRVYVIVGRNDRARAEITHSASSIVPSDAITSSN